MWETDGSSTSFVTVLSHLCASVFSAFLITVGDFLSRAYRIGSVKTVIIFPTRSELIFVSYKKDSIDTNYFSTLGAAHLFHMLSGQRGSDVGDCTL